MTHQATVELLSRFLDGDVDSDERSRVEALIESDSEAREIYEGLSRVRGSLGRLEDAAPPAYLGVLVQRRIALEAETTGIWGHVDRRLRQWLLEPILLPAFAVVLALGAMLYVLANGLALTERRREPLFLSAPPGSEAPSSQTVAGHELLSDAGRWVERGVTPEDAAAARRIVVPADDLERWSAENPELAPFAGLGSVLLKLEGETVELVFEAGDG